MNFTKKNLLSLAKVVIEFKIKFIYIVTENKYIYPVYILIGTYGLCGNGFGTVRLSCFAFTSYFITLNLVVYAVCKYPPLRKQLADLVTEEFLEKYLG